MTKFNELALSTETLRAIQDMGYRSATEIQERAIPIILKGRDVLGRSNTGTGKTAAFGIPAIEKARSATRYPSVLILCPTRELVMQVAAELRKFAKYKEGVKITPVYGGQPIERQIQLLKKGSAIVVGTPGRIMDHLRRRTLRLNELDLMILDEADEMLNMGFKEDIETILRSIPENRAHQTLLFSATWPKAILQITDQFQQDPVHVEIQCAQRTIDTVKQFYYEVPKGKKTAALHLLLEQKRPALCIIFCNTKKMVDALGEELKEADLAAACLHGDMKQDQRSRVMKQFKNRALPILIATDVAARGIDVDDVDLVVNYDLPQDHEYYIHRVGRTGRAGKSGEALTLISGSAQKREMREIMNDTRTRIEKQSLPASHELQEQSRRKFIAKVKQACDEGVDEDSIALTYELMAEGIAPFNLISALISMTAPKTECTAFKQTKTAKTQQMDVLRFDIGKKAGITVGHIVAAIVQDAHLDADRIGQIRLHAEEALAEIDHACSKDVLRQLKQTKIKGKNIHVSLYEPAEEKTPQSAKKAQTAHPKKGKAASAQATKQSRAATIQTKAPKKKRRTKGNPSK